MSLSLEEMKSVWLFHEDGTLTWLISPALNVKIGDKAGCLNSAGYVVVTYKKYQYKVHRLVYAYHTNLWPKLVDHKDCMRSNNQFSNLRNASYQLNASNTNKTTGVSKFRGVSFLRGRPRAFIQAHGVREFLGYFKTEEEAAQAYLTRRAQLNPELA